MTIDSTAQRRRIQWLRSLNAHTPLTIHRETIKLILDQMEAELPPEGEPSSWPPLPEEPIKLTPEQERIYRQAKKMGVMK